jgi:hypothetical protein
MPKPSATPAAPPMRPIPAIKDGRISLVDPGEIDYEPIHHSQGWAESTHMAPLLGSMKGARAFISSKYTSGQYLPLVEKEAPLVDTLDEETGNSYSQTLGEKIGHRHARVEGVVHSVSPEAINIQDADGKLHTHEIHRHFGHARKTFTNDRPLVKPGDVVTAGRPIAASNYVTDDGRLAYGRNLRVGYLPGANSSTFEDAILVSESGAKKLTSEHLFGYDLDHSQGAESKKSKWVSLFPNKYTNEQLEKIGPDGHALPGAKLYPGDPMLLGYEPRSLSAKDSALGNLHKVLRESHRDLSQVWSKPAPALVVDAVKSRRGLRVNVVSEMPLRAGDKLSARSGSKGVVSQVLPDHQMVHDAQGNPMEILINPASIIARVNPTANFEALLGKIAEKRGKPYHLPAFAKESWRDYVEGELKANGLSDKEDLTDPTTGRRVPNVMTGKQYFLKLEHQSYGKESGRGEGSVDFNDQPTKGGEEGAKRMGGLVNVALLSHGALGVLRDSQLYRTGKNEDLWRQIRSGNPLPAPKTPFIFNKFINSLKAAGINVERKGDKFHLKAMTDADVDAIAPHEVRNDGTVDRDGNPEPGGLMDHALHGGPEGLQFSRIQLDSPTSNPLFEEPLRRFLGLTQNKYRDVIAGRETLNGKTGADAIVQAAKGVNLDEVIKNAKETIRSGRKSRRDDAVKLLHFATGFQRSNLTPNHAVITKIPVLPPAYRPISQAGNVQLISDSNYLYRDLFAAQRALRTNREDLPEHELADQKLAVYDAIKAVQGLGDPINPETQAKGVKGFIRAIAGTGGPKTGLYMSKVIGHPVNAVGRSVIIPDGNLDMDEVGIPEKSAWKGFGSFAMGEMVRDGMPQRQAALELEKKSAMARKYLLKAMSTRPIMVSRDPALHRFSIMGARARLRSDNNIAVSPLVVKPYGADFDGNCIGGSSKIIVVFSIPNDILANVPWSRDSRGLLEELLKEQFSMQLAGSTKLISRSDSRLVVEMEIQDFPHHPETLRFDKNGACVYDVPEGIEILSTDTDGKGTRWSPVTRFTAEEGCDLYQVVTSRGKEVTCSANESLAVYAPGGKIRRRAPEGAEGELVPVVKRPKTFGDKYDSLFGWMIGSFLSDGWVNEIIGYTKSSLPHRVKFLEAVDAYCGASVFSRNYQAMHEAETNCGIGGLSSKIHIPVTTPKLHELAAYLDTLYSEDLETRVASGIRSCLYKRMPLDLFDYSEEALLGVLAGLLDGDGTMSINRSRAKPQVLVQFSTSSVGLRDGIQRLCFLLGIHTSYSVTRPAPGRMQKVDNYQVVLSVPNVCQYIDRLPVFDNEAFEQLRQIGVAKDHADLVPLDFEIISRFCGKDGKIKPSSGITASSLAGYKNYCKQGGFLYGGLSRKLAERLIEAYAGEMDEKFNAFVRIVRDCTTGWERIKSCKKCPTEMVYDLEVPETKVFALADGLIVFDSMNFHIPIGDDAVRDVENMLPSKNLLSIKDRQAQYMPTQESILGAFNATTPHASKPTVTFPDRASALAAYHRGEIDINTPVKIAGTPR